MKFFMICQQEIVLVLPLLLKIHNKQLNLCGYSLNKGTTAALQKAFTVFPDYVNRIILDNNGLSDSMFENVMKGIENLNEIRSIVYRNNDISTRSLAILKPLLLRPLPHCLDELRIVNCRMHGAISEEIVDTLLKRSCLRKLALVKAGITSSVKKLGELITKSKFLIDLDISWNDFRPSDTAYLLKILSSNRQLQYFNFGWNMIQEQGSSKEYVQE